MAEPDLDKEEKQDIQVQSAPPGERRAHVPDNEMAAPNVSFRGLGGWIAGGIGAMIGWFGGNAYTENKLIPFKWEVDKLTRADILNRQGGVGAAVGSMPTGMEHMPGPMGGFGAGLGSPVIEEFHELNLIQSGKYPFAKFVKVFGRGTVAIGAAVVTGAAAALAYLTVAPKKKENQTENMLSALHAMPDEERQATFRHIAHDAVAAHGAKKEGKDWQASVTEKDAPQPTRGA